MSHTCGAGSGLVSGLVNTTQQVGGALSLAVLATPSSTQADSARAAGLPAAAESVIRISRKPLITVDVEVVRVEPQVPRATFGNDLKPVALWNVEHRDHRFVDRIRGRVELCFWAAFEEIDLY